MNDSPVEQIEDLGFDRVLKRLREVVAQLEAGQLSLEDSLRVYEEGVALARRGHQVLDHAEKRVELLVREHTRGEDEGALEAVPLDDGDRAGDSHGDIEQSG